MTCMDLGSPHVLPLSVLPTTIRVFPASWAQLPATLLEGINNVLQSVDEMNVIAFSSLRVNAAAERISVTTKVNVPLSL